MKINSTLRTLLLNISDMLNEHSAAIGYALRAAVSRRERDHAELRGLLSNAMGLSERTDELIRQALASVELRAKTSVAPNHARRGMACGFPYWACQECDAHSAHEGVRVCWCKTRLGDASTYRQEIGFVDGHAPMVRTMIAEGHVFDASVAAWAMISA